MARVGHAERRRFCSNPVDTNILIFAFKFHIFMHFRISVITKTEIPETTWS